MFEQESIKVLHLETTTVCNAACPQCARENPELYNDKTDRCTLSLDQIKELFDLEFFKQLDKVFACGDFGDPAASHETLSIFKFFRSINPSIELGMNTNGGVQNVEFWKELGKLLSSDFSYCVFSIDGLEDTNHIYRVNVRWSKLMNNVKAFIGAGGKAHWDMLIFKHNEHQVNKARDLAKQLGFTHFRAKVSKRFISRPIEGLLPPTGFELPNVNNTKTIECYAQKEKSLYVAANGEVFPCCWIGTSVFSMDENLRHLLNDKPNYQSLVNSWNVSPHKICTNACGVDNNKSSFEQQWTINEVLQ